jgi:prevent-host-death family protein
LRTVPVRELKENTSTVLRRVREGEEVGITHRGELIARLVPPHPVDRVVSSEGGLFSDIDTLASEVSAAWPEGLSVTEAVRTGRVKP